jgi:hypothetical protein
MYQEFFWATVAPVAPVIGLAHAVTIGKYRVRVREASLEQEGALMTVSPYGKPYPQYHQELIALAGAIMGV